jgi:tetratricopeptide (TPR) repeat protein
MRAAISTALLLLLASPLHAEARDKRAAAAHFQQGSALYAEGRWSEALVEFEAGYEAYPLRGFLVNIGQCYRKLERLDEAADAWRRFLATHPSDARLRGEVEEALAEVETARAAESPRPSEPAREAARAPVEPPRPAGEGAQLQIATGRSLSESGEKTANLDVVAPQPTHAELVQSPPPAKAKKSRAWVWALVGVAAASVTVAAVTAGVVESQASTPRGGSLGLIDGRR